MRHIAVPDVNYEVLFVAVSRRHRRPACGPGLLECLARAHEAQAAPD
jgi:hypothetical protein